MKTKLHIIFFIATLIFFIKNDKAFSQKVYISEVFYDTPLQENNRLPIAHNNGEFVELYNPSSMAINLGGWKLKDDAGQTSITFSDKTVINPKSFLLVVYSADNYKFTDLFPSISYQNIIYHSNIILWNYMESLYLYDRENTLVDVMTWGASTNNELYARNGEYDERNGLNCLSLHRVSIKRDTEGNGTFSVDQWNYSTTTPFSNSNIADSSHTDPSASEGGNPGDEQLSGDVNQNFITTRTYLSADKTKYIDNIEYFDGLGRPFQQVAKGVTPNKSNLATLQHYDGLGRLNKKWLTMPTSSDFYLPNDTNQIKDYYGDIRPFVETVFETSALNRVKEEVQAGATCWNEHSMKTYYLTNNTKDSYLKCKYFDIVNNELADKGFYDTGELFVTKTIDIVGNESYLFKDKLDREILIRQIATNYDSYKLENHDTYYVYDDFGNLRYVLPPMMNGDINDLELFGYQYFYDERNRCIEKILPGGVRYNYIYDRADRLRLIQDGNQREKNEWSFIKYDDLGRQILTGVFCTKLSIPNLNIKVNSNDLTEKIDLNSPYWYTSTSLPGITSLAKIHTVMFYDNYNYLNTLPNIHKTNSELNSLYCDSEWENAKGLLTCKKVFVENDDNYIFTKYRYDYRGNPIQIIETRENGGYLNEYYKYSFTGNILQKRTENNFYGYKEPDVIETYRYSYDHADRLDTTYYSFKVPDREEQSFVISLNVYNELGQLEEKKLHRENANFLNSIYYKYNILGQISEIDDRSSKQIINYTKDNNYKGNITQVIYEDKNAPGNIRKKEQYEYEYDQLNRLTSASYLPLGWSSNNMYHEDISYDKNGNIIEKGNIISRYNTQQLYFAYNGNQVRKITNGSNQVYYYKNQMFQDNADLEVEYLYDNVGNMIVDQNKGISRIKYNNSNLPQMVQMQNGNQIKYKYDAEGRKLQQTDIFALEHINCPIGEAMDLEEGQIKNSNNTEYVGNVIYKNPDNSYPVINDQYENLLHRINLAEGHIEVSKENESTIYEIKYHLKDHLGNVRAELGLGNWVSKLTNYYPFGMEWDKSSDIEFAYNGKEKMETHGFNMYDYGARFYDQTIGRWHSMDPLAEKYYSISPYAYCANNPVMYIDPDGREWFFYSLDGQSDPTWNWRDESEYNTGVKDENGNEVVLKGYSAVVVFDGSLDEKLDQNQNINGTNAITANVTVYGPNGGDDVANYTGFTMSSNSVKYGIIADGDYIVNYDKIGKSGSLKSNWAVNKRGNVQTYWDNPNAPNQIDKQGRPYKNGIFIHATNKSGFAGGNVSKGCLLIKGGTDWNNYNKQLNGVSTHLLQVRRKWFTPYKLPFNK